MNADDPLAWQQAGQAFDGAITQCQSNGKLQTPIPRTDSIQPTNIRQTTRPGQRDCRTLYRYPRHSANMASALLAPPTSTSPESALHLSQAAPSFFASQSSFTLPWPLSLLTASESQEKWQIYNNIFVACLQSGDNESAYLCLEELTDRFGKDNERVMALNGLYEEATANNDKELQAVLGRYEELLQEDPTLFAVQKRRAALLRSMGKTSEAVAALTELLDASPTDAESWAELADVYLTQGLYEQAIFSLEEVLLVTPNAWNIHARLGEVLFLASNKAESAEKLKGLSEAMRRFCRSIELCDDYLRGYYGLKLVRLPTDAQNALAQTFQIIANTSS